MTFWFTGLNLGGSGPIFQKLCLIGRREFAMFHATAQNSRFTLARLVAGYGLFETGFFQAKQLDQR